MTKLKNKGYIYKVTNIVTGQFYIGQRSSYKGTPEDDLGIHYFTSSKIVKPLFKNSTSEWKREILYRDIQFAETLDDMEGFAIHRQIKDKLCLNRYDPLIRPGFITAGKHRSEETKRKMSIAKKGKHLTEAQLNKMKKVYCYNGKEYLGREDAIAGIHTSVATLKRMVKLGLVTVKDSEENKEYDKPIDGERFHLNAHPVTEETKAKRSASVKIALSKPEIHKKLCGRIPWNKKNK